MIIFPASSAIDAVETVAVGRSLHRRKPLIVLSSPRGVAPAGPRVTLRTFIMRNVLQEGQENSLPPAPSRKPVAIIEASVLSQFEQHER